MESTSPLPRSHWRRSLSALLGFAMLPTWVVLDSLFAIGRGWSPEMAGAFGLFSYVAAGLLAAALLLVLSWPRLRRAFDANLAGCWVFGLSSLAACGVAEAALTRLWPTPEFHLRLPNSHYTFEANLFQFPGVSAKSHVAFNRQGVRGPDWPPRGESYRLLCLGDSATECLFIDDAATWTAGLAKELPEIAGKRTWVGAAAVSEYATAQHAKFLQESPLVDEVDCVVAMVGVNDFLRSLMQLDVQGISPPWWLRTRILGLARYVWNGHFQNGYYYDYDGRKLRYRRLGRPMEPYPLDQRKIASEYQQRLIEMATAAKSRGVRLVFVTQPVLWDDFLGEAGLRRLWLARSYPVPREWSSVDVGNCRETIDEYNDVMLDVARATGTEVVDVSPALTGWDDNFIDDYHLSVHGCALLAQALAHYFRDHPAKE